jgi:hypothetical protein
LAHLNDPEAELKVSFDGEEYALFWGGREARIPRASVLEGCVEAAAALSGLGGDEVEKWRAHPGQDAEKWEVQPKNVVAAIQGFLEEPIKLGHITEIENPKYLERTVSSEAIVSSSAFAYAVPSSVRGDWTEGRGEDREELSRTVEIEPNSSLNMEIAGATSQGKYYALLRLFPSARSLRITDLSYRTVYRLRVRPPVFTLEKRGDLIVDEKGFEYKAYGVYVVADDQIQFPASSLVRLTGKPLPDPKTQKTTLLVTQVEFPENVEGYDPEALRRLAEVLEGKSVEERARWVFDNFESYSRIVGRRNLAKATLIAYFTPIWVTFNGELQRGWANVLIVGDTTTAKSETVRKAIWLLKAGTLVTAETASAVGLTGTATQTEREGWSVDWGFLVLNDRRLLVVDGAHKLRMSQWAALAESERSGVVTIAKAAKDSAYARTRQIKIANPIDPDSERYMTKNLGSFLYPIQATSTFLDLMSVARIDLCVFADSNDVRAEEINVKLSGEYDRRLDLLSEALKWAWGEDLEIAFTPEAEKKILDEATELYKLFFSEGVPLASIDLKWKLARLSASLACLTLSTVDFKHVTVEEGHVAWIMGFIKDEYTNAELHTLVQETRHEAVTEEDAKELLNMAAAAINVEPEDVKEILKFIVLQGRVTRDQLKEKFNLARTNQLNPLVSMLQNEKLIKSGKGFYPTSKLIELHKILGQVGQVGQVKIDIPTKIDSAREEENQLKLDENIFGQVGQVGQVKIDIPTKSFQDKRSLALQIFTTYPDEALGEGTVLGLFEDPYGISREEGRKLLEVLERDGLIFQPRPGFYKLSGGG